MSGMMLAKVGANVPMNMITSGRAPPGDPVVDEMVEPPSRGRNDAHALIAGRR